MSTQDEDPEEGGEDVQQQEQEQEQEQQQQQGWFNPREQWRELRRDTLYERTTREMNNNLMEEVDPAEIKAAGTHNDISISVSTRLKRRRNIPFWARVGPDQESVDHYFDYAERTVRSSLYGDNKTKTTNIPSLKDCQSKLKNDYADDHRKQSDQISHQVENVVLNIISALIIYAINTLSYESFVMIGNACLASYYFIYHAPDYEVKLDFAFIAFAVIFPLTFLIQQTFNRRDQALIRLADFKACVLSSALMTFTVDWSSSGDNNDQGGRLDLPGLFNKKVLEDYENIVLLTYEYLSMPSVSHARHFIFFSKQEAARKVHGIQNDIVKLLNLLHFNLSQHTETMRDFGFPSGEASRLHQYHQYLQQRFEQLRLYKYYRTPQSARSFGRAYILILPWICGPYFNFVNNGTGDEYAIVLAAFTFLVLLGLLNAQRALEDPFVPDEHTIFPGIDNVRLDFEMATILQSLNQFFLLADIKDDYKRASTLGGRSIRVTRDKSGEPLLNSAVLRASSSLTAETDKK